MRVVDLVGLMIEEEEEAEVAAASMNRAFFPS